MYDGMTGLQIAGQLLLAALYLGTGVINASTKFGQHLDRMVAMNVPAAKPALILGFALQFAGGLSLLLNYRTDIGAAILILFTVAATAIFHRWWLLDDPLRRHLHLSFVFSNVGLCGGLLLVM